MVKFQEGQSIRALGGLRSRRDLIRTAAGGVLAASLPLFSQKQTGAAQDSDTTDIDVATITAQAISRFDDPANPKNGKLKLKDELLSGLDKEAAKVVRKFVNDVNKKKIGMAFFSDESTVQLYGSELALDRGAGPESSQEPPVAERSRNDRSLVGPAATTLMYGPDSIADSFMANRAEKSILMPESSLAALNGAWVDWWGVHFYLDSWWTARLWELSGWAVGAIAGALVSVVCSTGVACLAAGAMVGFVWEFLVWRIIKPFGPHDLIVHCPWWGWVHVQPRRSGMWYHNAWFRSWMWT